MHTILETHPLHEEDMIRFSYAFAPWLQPGDCVSLLGTLGAGKTTFARAVIQNILDEAVAVPSPTYTLLQQYDTPHGQIFHYDFYRLEDPEEVWELGLESAQREICLIEWPEKGDLPENFFTLTITFSPQLETRTLYLQFSEKLSGQRFQDMQRLILPYLKETR